MTEEEQYRLLAEDGMLVKRPLLIGPDFVLTGFRRLPGRTGCYDRGVQTGDDSGVPGFSCRL